MYFGRANPFAGEVPAKDPSAGGEADISNQKNMMRITSNLFRNNGYFPIDCTCDGKEFTPPLEFHDVPDGAKSLALILRDPDAPSGQFYHWVVWNIDPGTKTLDADSVPKGATQGLTSDMTNFYIGPCPPSGTHNYYFDLYALDTVLTLPEATNAPQLKAAMQGHILEQAELTAKYR